MIVHTHQRPHCTQNTSYHSISLIHLWVVLYNSTGEEYTPPHNLPPCLYYLMEHLPSKWSGKSEWESIDCYCQHPSYCQALISTRAVLPAPYQTHQPTAHAHCCVIRPYTYWWTSHSTTFNFGWVVCPVLGILFIWPVSYMFFNILEGLDEFYMGDVNCIYFYGYYNICCSRCVFS